MEVEKPQKVRILNIQMIRDSCKSWWHSSYGVDWAVSIILFIIVHGVTFFVTPLQRFLPPNDPTVGYPKMADIVPNSVLFLLCLALPLVAIGLMQIKRKSAHDFHHATMTLIITILLVNTVTTSLKYAAGRYRPNWVAIELDGTDGRLSCPSGHSSNAFAGMLFLVLYLHGKFRIYSEGHTSSFAKSILLASPLSIAFFVALSRTIDYHHNYSDIIAGAMVGVGVAYYTYFLYYPPLSDKHCDLPKVHADIKTVEVQLAEVTVHKQHSSQGPSATVAIPCATYEGKEIIEPTP
jgi:membrane-associated phospholipid phosphatase